jgi:hypothetical protein
LLAALGALLALPTILTPAGAALSSQGPADPALGIPTFFADATGVRLAPCASGAPNCSATPASFRAASGSLFYFAATATVTTQTATAGTTAPSSVLMALQATQPGPSVFQRVRIQVEVPATGVYTVTYPYGSQQFNVSALNANGPDINVTNDSAALGGPIGPFLQSTGTSPTGFIGDNATPSTVIGSPSNRNFIRIQGTGINPNPADPLTACGGVLAGADCVQNNLFVLQGQLAPSLVASPATVAFANQAIGTTSAPQTVTVTNTGGRPFGVSAVSNTGPFAVDPITDTCTGNAVGPDSTCTVDVTFTPVASGAASGVLSFESNDPSSPLSVALTGSTPVPGIGLAPAAVNFGNQPSGTTSGSQPITVTNTGGAALHVSAVSVTGTNPAEFTQTSNCAGTTLAPGAACTANVAFAPTTSAARSANLSITSDAPASPHTVALSGTGTPPAPAVAFSPTSLAFGNQTTGTRSATQSITVRNTGNANLNVTNVALGGTNPGDFAQANTCAGATVAPTGTCTLTLSFAPTANGARSAVLSMTDNAPASPHVMNLTGTGLPPTPAVSLTPTAVNFPDQQIGRPSAISTVTVSNSGTGPLTVSAVTFTGTNPGDFTQSNTCVGASVAPGGLCTASVTWSPTATGRRTANLAFTDNAPGSPHAVPVAGTAINVAVSTSTARLSFGSQRVGTTSSVQSVLLTNVGTVAVTVSNVAVDTNDFRFGRNTCTGTTLAPNAACSAEIMFVPAASGSRAGTLSFTDTATGSPHTVSLTGTGVAPLMVTDPTALDYGNVFILNALLGTAPSKVVTVTNRGNAPMVMAGAVVTGANASDYVIDANSCTAGLVIAPGGRCSVTVSFHPGLIGSRSAELRITSDAPNSPRIVPMTGQGSLLPV